MFLFRRRVFEMSLTYSKLRQFLPGYQNIRGFHYKSRLKPKFSVTSLSQICGADPSATKQKMNEQPKFKKSDNADMRKCAAILQNAGYSSEYIRNHINLLSLPPAILKNFLYVCQEFACYNDKIGPSIINFDRFINFRISALKEFKVIPSNVNVLDSILYYLDIPKFECNVEVDELEKIKQVYWKFYNFYLKRELQIDDDDVRKLYKEDFLVSFRHLRENLYLLRKSFGFTTADLLKMPFLLRTDPENTISILRSARGVNLKQVIVSHPRLLTVPSENIQVVHQFLKKNDGDFSALLNDPMILSMDINKLMHRLAKLVRSPSLSVFKDHPRLPALLRKCGTANERVLMLKKANMECFDIFLLTCSCSLFLNHILDGIDKNWGEDLAFMVSHKLSQPMEDVFRELKKNECFMYVPLTTVRDNFDYLVEMGFSKEDIYRSVQILLYPRNVLENSLTDILMNSVVVQDAIEYQVLNKRFFLPLALYYIEKGSHFSNSNMWCENGEANSDSLFSTKYVASS